MQKKIDVSICIVIYENSDQVIKCIDSIYSSRPKHSFEIILVDNSPEPISLAPVNKKYKGIKYMRPLYNLGYGNGNNYGLSISSGWCSLILNPDTQVVSNSIDILVDYLKKNPRAAIVGPTLVDRNHRPYIQLSNTEITPVNAIFNLSIINTLFRNNIVAKRKVDKIYSKPTKVQVVPGSVFLIRTSSLRDIKGFDTSFFLYFEENDISRRLRQKGWEIWVSPKAKFIHLWEESTKKLHASKRNNIFINSRYLYLKKHFGMPIAYLSEFFLRLGKYELIIIGLFFAGTLLRLLYITENVVFHGELGDNYLAIKNILGTGRFPLLGPPTSHPWLSFGPYFYWIFTPILLFVQYSPVGMAYVFALVHSLVIPINYITFRKLFNQKIAVISSFFITISPAYMNFARESRFFSLTLLLFYPFFYYFFKKKYLLSGIFYAVLLNFHLTPIVYIPSLLIIFLHLARKKVFNFVKPFGIGVFVGMWPFVLYDTAHKFEMTKNVILWIPYRILGFIGIIPKNTLSEAVVSDNVTSGFEFIKQTFIPVGTSKILTIVIFTTFAVLLVRGARDNKKLASQVNLPMSMLVIGYLAIFVHGSPPSHYFLPLYPLLILVVSIMLSRTKTAVLIALSSIIIILNMNFFFSNQWYFKDQRYVSDEIAVPYTLQLKATKSILLDAKGEHFSIKRVGPHDQFDQNYSQNFRYLLWKGGNEPITGSETIYTVYENRPVLEGEKVIFSEGGLVVTKKYEIDTIIT